MISINKDGKYLTKVGKEQWKEMSLQKGDIVKSKINGRQMIVDDPDFYVEDCFCTWTDDDGQHRAIFSKSELIFVERKTE